MLVLNASHGLVSWNTASTENYVRTCIQYACALILLGLHSTHMHTTHTMLGLSYDSVLLHRKMRPLASLVAAVGASRAAMPPVSSALESATFVHCPCY